MDKQRIAIYGASGFGRELAWLAESHDSLRVLCFIDDNPTKCGSTLNGIPVYGFEDLCNFGKEVKTVVGIGDPKIRDAITRKVASAGLDFITLIHPDVKSSKLVEIGRGTVICPGTILTTNIKLGKHVQINLGCTIGHDVVMDDYATLAPGVHISGWVHIGKRVYIGTGAVIINGTQDKPIIIGDDAVIGAGACVTLSIPEGETWVGVPAKVIKPLPKEKDI